MGFGCVVNNFLSQLIQNQGEFMERSAQVHESYQKVVTELLMYLPFEFPVGKL